MMMEFGLLYDGREARKEKYQSLVAQLQEIFEMPVA